MHRRWTVLFLTIMMTLAAPMGAMALSEPAYCLIEAETGTVISSRDESVEVEPAGMTKLMSFLIFMEALESGRANAGDTVSVSQNAAKLGGTSVFLDAGSGYSFEELLRAAVICSANDATLALAEHLSGSEEAFVAEMDQRASELGLSAKFTNATGLPGHGSSFTAEDAAKVACELARHQQFFKYSSVYMDTFAHASGRTTEMVNANRLVRQMTGCDGMVTGSSAEGGYNAAVSLKSGSARFIAVVCGAKNSSERFSLAQTLLAEASSTYTVKGVAEKNGMVKRDYPVENGSRAAVDIFAGEDCSLLVKKGSSFDKRIELPETLSAPISAGEQIGRIIVTADGETLAEIPLICMDNVEEQSYTGSLQKVVGAWLSL